MMMSLPLLAALVFAAVAVTSFISGVFGMAGGLILMGVLTVLLPVRTAMVLHAIVQFASNAWRAVVWRRFVAVRIVVPYVAGGLVALAAFTVASYQPERAGVLLMLGVMPFLGWLTPARLAPRIEKPGTAAFAGLTIVGLQIACGVSGPALDLFFVKSGLDRRTIVATKAVAQASGHVMKLVYFGAVVDMTGGLGALPPWFYAGAVALAMAGPVAARGILERLTDAQFRSWSQYLLMAIGVVYLVQGTAMLLGWP